MLLYLIEDFFLLHGIFYGIENDKKWAQNDNFAGNLKSLKEFFYIFREILLNER